MIPSIDRAARQRVSTGVIRISVIIAALAALALAPACGGKSKKDKTSPDTAENKDPKDLKDVDPEAGDDVKTTKVGGDDDSGDSGDGDKGDKGEGAGDDLAAGPDDGTGDDDPAEPPPPPPEIKPEILDISPAEAAAKVRAHLQKARAALDGTNKDPHLAIKEAQAALAVDPNDTDALAYLAHAYYFRKLDDTATVLLDMAFYSEIGTKQAAARANPRIWYVYGLLFDRAGQREKAQLFYEGCRQRDPNFKSALLNLGVHYLRASRYADAVTIFEKLTGELKVRTATSWTNLASAYRGRSASASNSKAQRNDWLLKAETNYKKAIQLDKTYANAHYNLGLLYLDADPFPQGGADMNTLVRLERAKTYFDEYRDLPGADLEILDERIRVLNKLVKKEKKRLKAEEKKKNAKDDDW